MKTPAFFWLVWVAIIPMWLPAAGCGQEREESRPAPPEREVQDNVRRREGGPPQGQPRPDDTRREIERLRGQMIELLNDGEGEQAAEIKQRISELERQQGRPERMEGQMRIERMEGPDRIVRFGPDQNDSQRRLRHLEIAIEHLRQAGFHEPAEQLARQAERMRQQFQGNERQEEHYEIHRQEGPQGPQDFGPRREERRVVIREENPAMREELNDLRGEVRELRQILQDLQQQLQQVRK